MCRRTTFLLYGVQEFWAILGCLPPVGSLHQILLGYKALRDNNRPKIHRWMVCIMLLLHTCTKLRYYSKRIALALLLDHHYRKFASRLEYLRWSTLQWSAACNEEGSEALLSSASQFSLNTNTKYTDSSICANYMLANSTLHTGIASLFGSKLFVHRALSSSTKPGSIYMISFAKLTEY